MYSAPAIVCIPVVYYTIIRMYNYARKFGKLIRDNISTQNYQIQGKCFVENFDFKWSEISIYASQSSATYRC